MLFNSTLARVQPMIYIGQKHHGTQHAESSQVALPYIFRRVGGGRLVWLEKSICLI